MVNGLKAMFASKGTSLLAIATVHKIKLNKLLDYNDLSEDGLLPEDQFVYLEKKQKEGKVDYYTTKTPETLYDISQNLGVQLAELATYNNMDRKASIGSGSRVALKPGLKPDIVQNNNRNAQTHIVEAKEGLYAIARKYSISVQDLKAMNNMASDDLKVGQQIYISK